MEDKKKPKDYTECDCSKCKNTCIHKDAYRRLPTEIGGLGLCKRACNIFKFQIKCC